MFVEKCGKFFLHLSESQLSIIMGLIQERLKEYENTSEEDYAELLNLQDLLIHYRRM